MTKPAILVVDDDRIILDSLCEYLKMEGYDTASADSYRQAMRQLQSRQFSLVITDINLPDATGFDLLSSLKKNYPKTVVIIITGYGTIESAVEAIKMGAFDYMTKPIVDDDLLMSVQKALRQQSLITENINLRLQLDDKYSLQNIISQDYKMARIFELVEAVADSTTTILMTGPSGTGKSILARAVHQRSWRKDKPFVEVSCGALPETLLESELFGHVKGAFTGAVKDKQGKFLAANGGTIFLDEISSASAAMQVKLLRILQERQFEPVGSNKTIKVDTRVILASNTDLKEEVKAGRFREDLYYRINVVAINIPPLVERIIDVPLLAESFLNRFCQTHRKSILSINPEVIETLQRYSWPGNVRELENVMERAVLLSKGPTITLDDLPLGLLEQCRSAGSTVKTKSLKEALAAPEKEIIRKALQTNNWSRQETAKILQINRTTLYKKMKRYGLEDEAKKMGL